MSSAALSLDISHLVSRDLAGEAVDTVSEGEVLAEKYRELGMSADLIGKAIVRAAGMARLALAPAPAKSAPPQTPSEYVARLRPAGDVLPDHSWLVAAATEPDRPESGSNSPLPDDLPEAKLGAAFEADFEKAFAEVESLLLAEIARRPVEAARPTDGLAPMPPAAAASRARWPMAAVRRVIFGG